jgi:hypothetical protein
MKVAVVGLDWHEQYLLAVAYEMEMGREKARLFSTYASHKKLVKLEKYGCTYY